MAGEERDRLRAALRDQLVQARARSGLTQVQLAKALGRPQSFVSNYERGERRVEVADLVLICRALGANARDMVGRLAELRPF